MKEIEIEWDCQYCLETNITDTDEITATEDNFDREVKAMCCNCGKKYRINIQIDVNTEKYEV